MIKKIFILSICFLFIQTYGLDDLACLRDIEGEILQLKNMQNIEKVYENHGVSTDLLQYKQEEIRILKNIISKWHRAYVNAGYHKKRQFFTSIAFSSIVTACITAGIIFSKDYLLPYIKSTKSPNNTCNISILVQ